jgi:uncharacterized protein (DUF1501 family)
MAMLSLGFAPAFLTRAAAAAALHKRLLIAVFQRGAVDGLNMVVPFGDAEYYRLRPSIGVPRPGGGDGTAVDLDGFFGLHPRMSPLVPLWRRGQLAIVHACGSPDTTRSHFDAQDYMETATPGIKTTREGWLNRCLQASGEATPLRGVALSRQMPRSLQGRAPALAFPSVDAFQFRGGAGAQRQFEQTYTQAQDSLLTASAREALEAMNVLRSATAGAYVPAAGADYPRSAFGQALQEIARLAKADVGLEIAFAEAGGWDTHVNQGSGDGQLAGRLDDFARALAALSADLGDRMADTVILTMSEFGRAAAENGNGGTDHGHGNAMLLIGGPVSGGKVYGRWPGLRPEQRYDERDLAVTTDFREVFSEVVTRHLRVTPGSAATVFPGFTATAGLGLIRA